ncbi:beta-lactamase-like protein [Lipomyces orientalis]|uniref:Beta-lactamase-like protein n=1 Tax=Lipomyces orientalis TaxID=1233043 RepID=A0ACC3TJK3_9ASCO
MNASAAPSLRDQTDFRNADRGFVSSLKPCIIKARDGRVIWDNDAYSFLYGAECSETANPKLWRHAQLACKQGLFEVTLGIFQIRGLDLSNMTVIEGDRGVIVVDPLASVECAEAALGLYRHHRGNRKVTGLIYTHSHGDHFGGCQGVLPGKESEGVPILAPEKFLDHAISENIYAGNAMSRRAVYMYGDRLSKGPTGQLGSGIGATVSTGTVSLLPPTIHISRTGQEETIDGVRFVFQITPGTEAPAEMNFHLPQRRALCIAENATHSLHNIATLRGATVRDAISWSMYLDEAIMLFTDHSDVVFSQHLWPVWNQNAIVEFLSEQRDLYAYLHDQTVRMMNDGQTGIEIAENLELPVGLREVWHAQGFYGTVSHNVKAIYQRYMTWFDGSPAHLWEHPPVAAAKRYVSCMGGIDEVIQKARSFTQEGDLRFAVTLLNHAVFADPDNGIAKHELASCFEKLGYGCENGPWRNFYLSGASELRGRKFHTELQPESKAMTSALTLDHLIALLAVRIDGPRAQTENFAIDICVTDLEQRCRLILSNGALIRRVGCLTHTQLLELLATGILPEKVHEQRGDSSLLVKLFSLVVKPNPSFNIVVP